MDERQQERVESLKSGLLGIAAIAPTVLLMLGLSALLPALGISNLFFNFPLNFQVPTLAHGLDLALAGFLFGVTYRYTVRQDLPNFQLQAGTVMAFGLVRGLGQGDVGWQRGIPWPEFVSFLGESLILFASAALLLYLALHRGWVKPCDRPPG